MKKFFIMLAVWAIAIAATLIASHMHKQGLGEKYDVTAIPYLEEIVPKLSQWDPVVTKKLMTVDIFEDIPEDKFNAILVMFSSLGTLKEIKAIEFDNLQKDRTTKGGVKNIVEYTVGASYEKGEAELEVKLVDLDGEYEIYHFTVASEVFEKFKLKK